MENYHQCSHCRYKTTVKFLIRGHARNKHNGETDLQLFKCTSGSLERFACEPCNFKTFLTVSIRKHFQESHKVFEETISEYNCQKCHVSSFSELFLKAHTCSSKFEAPAVKPQCVNHEQFLFKNNTKEYKTYQDKHSSIHQDCAFRTKQEAKLDCTSVKVPPEENAQWYNCAHCSYRSKWKRDLERHLFRKHISTGIWFRCHHCPYKANDKMNLKKHITRMHAPPKETQCFQCKYCPYKSKEKRYLVQHISTLHAASLKKWLQCEQCSFKTLYKHSFVRHVKLKHTTSRDVKEFKCESCPSMFKLRADLNVHWRRQHTESELLNCGLCSYSCKAKGYLKRHSRVVHEERKWLLCVNCPFKTKVKMVLRKHLLEKCKEVSKLSD